MRYPVVIHKEPKSDYGVTIPDLPGCFSAGVTLDEAVLNAEEAILTHIEGLLLDHEVIPEPSSLEALQAQGPSDGFWAVVTVDLSELSSRAKRINITVPENILSKIDAFARQTGESRSGLLVSAALNYMSEHKTAI